MPTCRSIRQSSSSPARQYSHLPQRRLTVATWSPTRRSLTSLPTATTTPDGSTPNTVGRVTLRPLPSRRTITSRVRLTETAWTFTRTSSSAIAGTGTSSTWSTSGGPKRRMSTARIVVGMSNGETETAVDEETAIAENPLNAFSLLQYANIGEWISVDDQHICPPARLQHTRFAVKTERFGRVAGSDLQRAHRRNVKQASHQLQLPRVATKWQNRAGVRTHQHAYTGSRRCSGRLGPRGAHQFVFVQRCRRQPPLRSDVMDLFADRECRTQPRALVQHAFDELRVQRGTVLDGIDPAVERLADSISGMSVRRDALADRVGFVHDGSDFLERVVAPVALVADRQHAAAGANFDPVDTEIG